MLIRTVIRALVIAAVVVGIWAMVRRLDEVEISLYLLGAFGFIALGVFAYLDRRGSR